MQHVCRTLPYLGIILVEFVIAESKREERKRRKRKKYTVKKLSHFSNCILKCYFWMGILLNLGVFSRIDISHAAASLLTLFYKLNGQNM